MYHPPDIEIVSDNNSERSQSTYYPKQHVYHQTFKIEPRRTFIRGKTLVQIRELENKIEHNFTISIYLYILLVIIPHIFILFKTYFSF